MADLSKLFNKTLATRATTALVFVSIMILGIMISPYTLWLLFGIINVLSLVEFQKISIALPGNKPNHPGLETAMVITLGTIIYVIITSVALNWIDGRYIILVMPLLFLLFIYALYSRSESPLSRMSLNLASLLWISIPTALSLPIALIDGTFSPLKLIGIILLVWISDSFAYIVGSVIGKTPLFKRISPKKTWEGSAGGLVASLLFAFLLSFIVPEWSFAKWSVIAVLAVFLGTTGDLIESLLKRSVKIKDSGSILPGHGGFLDRFDAYFFSVPFIYTYLYLFNL